MSPRSVKHTIGLIFCIALFAASAWLGLTEGPGDFVDSATMMQRICSAAVTLYGVFGIGAAAGLLMRRQWSVALTILWGCALVVAAVAAPLAWAPGETPWWGVALGGIIVAGLAVAVLRIVRALVRRAGLVTGTTAAESREQ